MLTRSSIRKRTKLAGTKDMAKITQMETRTSTDVVILKEKAEKNTSEDCGPLYFKRKKIKYFFTTVQSLNPL